MVMQTADIPVRLAPGESDCTECADRLRVQLSRHSGLLSVAVSGPETLSVTYDPDRCSLSCVTDAADAIGAELGRRYRHEVLPVEGMDCPDCAQTIERALARVHGVTACSVNFAGSRMRVEYSEDGDVATRIRKQVKSLGYRIPERAEQGAEEVDERGVLARRAREIATAFAAFTTITGFALSAADNNTAAAVVYAVGIIVGGWPVAKAGLAAAWATRRPDINLLMALAVVGAAAIGAWLEAALVVVLFSIGEDLERFAIDRARRSLSSLLALTPQTARRIREGAEEEVPVEELVVGDLLAVRPGDRIPIDGDVTNGASAVDQSPITGESIPVDKTVGDAVYAGTMNAEGRLVVKVTRPSGDSTLARTAKAIEEAQAQRAPSERWVDSFARIYTPLVIGVAAATMVAPPLVGAGSFGDWFYRGLAFLILACPCALVVATPVAVVSALARASRAGVLVKGGAHLEAAATVKAVAVDKTGTLTLGEPHVAKTVPLAVKTDARLLRLAASLEANSEHPLAKAVVAEAGKLGVDLEPVTDFQARRGFGVEGIIGGRMVRAGKPAMFTEHPAWADAAGTVQRLEAEGRTVVVVADDERIAGVLGIADRIRSDARDSVNALRSLGVNRVVMLTGDHETAARAVAGETGVDNVRASLLPGDKVTAVEEIQAEWGPTAMVGDGVNDAPAQARSALGVAMGSVGSPTAIETADVALMGDDLAKLAGLIGLARWTRGVVRQNIMFSLAVKAVAAVLAVTGLLTLWMAVLADVGATLLVVANGLRLLRTRPFGVARTQPMLDVT